MALRRRILASSRLATLTRPSSARGREQQHDPMVLSQGFREACTALWQDSLLSGEMGSVVL